VQNTDVKLVGLRPLGVKASNQMAAKLRLRRSGNADLPRGARREVFVTKLITSRFPAKHFVQVAV
jgi:hypothetical protein